MERRDHSIPSSASAGERRAAEQRDEIAAVHLAAVRSAGTRGDIKELPLNCSESGALAETR